MFLFQIVFTQINKETQLTRQTLLHSCFFLYTVLSMFEKLREPSIANSCSFIHLMSNESLRPFYTRNSIKCLGILQCLFLYLLCKKEFIAYKLSVSSTLFLQGCYMLYTYTGCRVDDFQCDVITRRWYFVIIEHL